MQKFNNGRGAILCDDCGVDFYYPIFDENTA